MTKEELIKQLEYVKIHVARANGLLEDLDMDKDNEDFDLDVVYDFIGTTIKEIENNYVNPKENENE